MAEYVVLVSVPGLRDRDLRQMPRLTALVAGGDQAELVPSFPAVTCPVQANMLTGSPASEHGVVANGFYWRDRGEVEMWTSPNECIQQPQLWDLLHRHQPGLTTAAWFLRHTKGCGADYVCTEAPIHNPDGSESLWCYTRPESLYQKLFDELGHFPLHRFWGPLAGVESTAWIVDSAIRVAAQHRPNLFCVYLPHLDYAAQKDGPDSSPIDTSLAELDRELGRLIDGFATAYQGANPLWLVASEYVISPVDHVSYPNRALREAGLLRVREQSDGEHLDLESSIAWALADHQLAHVYIRDPDPQVARRAADVLASQSGVAEVLTRDQLNRYDLQHPHCGELVVISEPSSWQAYYWWFDDRHAPAFARSVDIHRKPGYDPVELFFDPSSKSIPLDATLVQGSHGAPAVDPAQRGVLLASQRGVFVERPLADTDVGDIVLRQYGI